MAAFNEELTRVPVAITSISVVLKDTFDENGDPYQSAHYSVRVVFSDGSTVVRKGDLVQYITPQQRQGLLDFMSALRTQAIDEFLP